MYLKRLELHGFKSFANKTVLDFQPGITLVVGPNGSGKSNIADAVRWVLGEQSAKSLRGGKMEDVIFAGSDKRKSLGMAEVSLTIDNSSGSFPLDFNEITVTRRLYRSGESDYMINKVPCRLKDIHELFMDTGIGREGFSMIGQGRVEEILLARPEERRSILEDAAGIIKYRYRKKEAAKKLEETQTHLLRIEDLLLELRSQEEPLRLQAEEAKVYQVLKKELDTLEMGMITGEIRIARDKLQKLQEQLSVTQQELLAKKTGLISAQSQEETIRLALEEKSEALARLQEDIYQISIKIENLLGQKRSDEERSEALEEQAANLEKEDAALQEEWADLSTKWQARQEEGADIASRLALDRQSLEARQEELNQAERAGLTDRQVLASKEENHFDLLKQDSSWQNDAVRYQQDLLALDRQEQRLEETRLQGAKVIQAAEEKQSAIKSAQVELAQELETQQGLLENQKKIVLEVQAAYEQKQQANRQLAGQRSQALSKYKLIEEMEKEGQGYSQGVREILHRKGNEWVEAMLGTVAQNLRVDKEYEIAAEIALGGSAQYIITQTEKSAQEAMRWLKNYDKGRVTFLPLDTIRNKEIPKEGVPRGKGILGRLVDLVDFEDRFLPVMEFLLGRIWIADQLSNAVARAKETGFRYRIVTLDGQVVNAGGSLTGGSVRIGSSGFISRRRQLEELEHDIRKLSQELVKGESEEETLLAQLNSAKEEQTQIQSRLEQIRLEQVARENELRFNQENLERSQKELKMMNWQQEEVDSERVRLTGIMAEIAQKREALAETIKVNEEEIRQLKQKLQEFEGHRSQRQNELTELRIQVAASEERLNAFEKEGQFLKDRMDQLQRMRQSQKENAALCRQRAKQHLKNAGQYLNEINQLQADIEQKEAVKANRQKERQALQEQVASLDENQRLLAEEVAQSEDSLRQMQIQEGRYLANLEEWGQRIQEQFGISWEEAVDSTPPIAERRKAQQQIKSLREQLGNMPQVNLGAVEEYDRLVERLSFLNDQTKDLVAAKADLEQVIQNMDQIVSKKFKETFDQINTCFNQVFQRLFDGGRANLYLTQPENLLETGVDIMAQPPGKKPQHLSLLSGGEKALTAISLLLAMLQVRPSPFSILDEIESNLDEANVDRFAALIKEYCQAGGQFIVITHRRGTMEVGDVIYGVSAEEGSGISRVISVCVTERKEG